MLAYPKFTILIYDALADFMAIFENKFVSIYLEIQKMLPSDINELSSLKKTKIYKLNDMGSDQREEVVNFFTKNYR